MKRIATITACLGVLLFAVAGQALATSGAHFFSATGAINDNGSLTVSWDEAGLGQQTVNYLLTGMATAEYACINNGTNHPKAANKESVMSTVTASTSATPENGRVKDSLTVPAPGPGMFSCPPGQTLVLASVTYSMLMLTDLTNMVTANIGTVSRTFVKV